jgi:hypothetical protein
MALSAGAGAADLGSSRGRRHAMSTHDLESEPPVDLEDDGEDDLDRDLEDDEDDEDDLVDEASDESFPASDPPAFTSSGIA